MIREGGLKAAKSVKPLRPCRHSFTETPSTDTIDHKDLFVSDQTQHDLLQQRCDALLCAKWSNGFLQAWSPEFFRRKEEKTLHKPSNRNEHSSRRVGRSEEQDGRVELGSSDKCFAFLIVFAAHTHMTHSSHTSSKRHTPRRGRVNGFCGLPRHRIGNLFSPIPTHTHTQRVSF